MYPVSQANKVIGSKTEFELLNNRP